MKGHGREWEEPQKRYLGRWRRIGKEERLDKEATRQGKRRKKVSEKGDRKR